MKPTGTYDRALNLLGFRARSTAELRRKLLQKGEPPDQVEEAIARLVEQKLLDDADYSRQFARSKVLGAGVSRRRIIQDLGRKGISRELAEQAVDGLQDLEGIDPAAAIHRVARKRWAAMAKLDDFTRKRRVYAFLARRGFNPDEIQDAMNRLDDSATA